MYQESKSTRNDALKVPRSSNLLLVFSRVFQSLKRPGDGGKPALAFFPSMALACRSVPGSALGNWNHPTAGWSQPQAEPQPHILVILDHELTQFILKPMQIQSLLPCCFSAELGEPETHLFSMNTGFLSCCSLPCSKAAATHLADLPWIFSIQVQLRVFKAQKCPGDKSARERCRDGTQTGGPIACLQHHILELEDVQEGMHGLVLHQGTDTLLKRHTPAPYSCSSRYQMEACCNSLIKQLITFLKHCQQGLVSH